MRRWLQEMTSKELSVVNLWRWGSPRYWTGFGVISVWIGSSEVFAFALLLQLDILECQGTTGDWQIHISISIVYYSALVVLELLSHAQLTFCLREAPALPFLSMGFKGTPWNLPVGCLSRMPWWIRPMYAFWHPLYSICYSTLSFTVNTACSCQSRTLLFFFTELSQFWWRSWKLLDFTQLYSKFPTKRRNYTAQ